MSIYRLYLERPPRNTGTKYVNFIMLNPSTADETKDDPTIRRLKSITTSNGYSRFVVTNLFALRSTKPKDLRAACKKFGKHYCIGPNNDSTIKSIALKAHKLVVAWGTNGPLAGRDQEVMTLLRSLRKPIYYLKKTKNGFPMHPLRIPIKTNFKLFN